MLDSEWLSSVVTCVPTLRTKTSAAPVPLASVNAVIRLVASDVNATVSPVVWPIAGCVDAPLPAIVPPLMALHSRVLPSR